MDTLVLNADAQPLSHLPLSTIEWQEAIKYMVLDKAHVLSYYDDWVVRSEKWSTNVPAIIMLREYMKPKTAVRFSKMNVFLRDSYVCQYCEKPLTKTTATLDHVLPVSKGGKSIWTNCVAACHFCNSHKSNHTHMKPISKPYKPDYWDLVGKRRTLPYTIRHESWLDYIG